MAALPVPFSSLSRDFYKTSLSVQRKRRRNISVRARASSSPVALIDYGPRELGIMINAIVYFGCPLQIVRSPTDILNSARVILPGFGGFQAAMAVLNKTGMAEALRTYIENDRPFLGIGLGLQLLFEASEENGPVSGLGLIPGVVGRFDSSNGVTVPHTGWSALHFNNESGILNHIGNRPVYFDHSYRAMPSHENQGWVSSTCNYGDKFIASVRKGNVYAVQFHPESSGPVGFSVLKRFLKPETPFVNGQILKLAD